MDKVQKRKWVGNNTSPMSAAPINISLSFMGTSSLGANREAIQNSRQAPTTLNVTIVMPSKPCVIASLPTGAISPQPAHAPNIDRCAISGRLFFSLSKFIKYRCKVNPFCLNRQIFEHNLPLSTGENSLSMYE